MAKNKISEWSATPANNTDIGGIDIAEGCAPSGINNAIRELMAQVKDMQTGADGDDLTIAGTLALTGGLTLDGSAGTSGKVLTSAGSGNTPTWGDGIPSGIIVMWSGSIATIPSGWYLCNGSNSTPDLRNKFIIGAYQDNAGVANTTITGTNTLDGGSKDAIVVSHTHTATVTDPGHDHSFRYGTGDITAGIYGAGFPSYNTSFTHIADATTGITVSNSTTGSSGTNANLPPYYALAFIMKA